MTTEALQKKKFNIVKLSAFFFFFFLVKFEMSPCSLYGVLKAERHLDSLERERGNRSAERGMRVW